MISKNFQYTATDYNYTPSVASPSALSQYGANFNHAFANPKQEDVLADPLVASALVVSTYFIHEKQANLHLRRPGITVRHIRTGGGTSDLGRGNK